MQACSHNVATFILSRFFIGVGIDFGLMPSPVLVTELAYPTHRGKATSLYNCVFYVGSIASSWITFGTFNIPSTWSWRIPSLLQIVTPLLQLCFIWFVPESPRWLVAKGRSEEARAILTKYHTAGDADSPLVHFQMREIERTVESVNENKKMAWSTVSNIDLVHDKATSS